jgi:AcrR family transcriptional regulator
VPRPRTDIEPRIVHAARELFLERGVDGASLRKIARAARTSIGMLYYYFPTKDELFLAVVEEVYSELLADIERALAPDAPIEDRLRRAFRRLGQVSELELQIIKLVVREMLVSSDRRDRLVERFQRGHLPLVFSALADGVRDGSLRDDLSPPLLAIASFAIGALPQLLRRAMGDRTPVGALPDGDALADMLIDVLFTGVGSR